MNSSILEFWGNMLLNAAKGSKQMDDLSGTMKGAGFQDMAEQLRQFADTDAFRKSFEEYFKVCRQANTDFQESMKEFLSLMDLVPRKDYDELKQKYEDLLKSVKEKKEAGNTFKDELKLQAEGLKAFESLVTDQAKQFQDLMSGFTTFYAQPKEAEKPSSMKKPAGSKKKTSHAAKAKK